MTLNQIKALWRLSRVPFVSVGVLPLILGYTLAWRHGFRGAPGLYFLSLLAVMLILFMTYYLGERNDLAGDRINRNHNQFSGGSRVLVEQALPAWVPLLLGYGCLAAAVLIGLYIFHFYKTGPWTLSLGAIGIFSGFYYSNKPFRWAYRGIGEVLIGFCYSWLPIATGFYLFSGFIGYQVFLLAIPVGLSIFNVILINEIPDEEADRAVEKRTLVVRYGNEKMIDVYIGVSVLCGLSLLKVMISFKETPLWLFFVAAIPLAFLLLNILQILGRRERGSIQLNSLCRNTLVINLLITMLLTLQQTLSANPIGR